MAYLWDKNTTNFQFTQKFDVFRLSAGSWINEQSTNKVVKDEQLIHLPHRAIWIA